MNPSTALSKQSLRYCAAVENVKPLAYSLLQLSETGIILVLASEGREAMVKRDTVIVLTCLVVVPAISLVLATVVLPRMLVTQDDFVVAAGTGDLDTVKRCIRRGLDVNATGYGKLNYGPARRVGVLARLRDSPFSDKGNEIVETPLHAAVRGGQQETAELLIDSGASVDARNSDGETALLVAADLGSDALGRALVVEGAVSDAADNRGRTPLHMAAIRGHDAMAELLLEHGADVNASSMKAEMGERLSLPSYQGFPLPEVSATQEGWTPLHLAACEGHDAMVHLLLEHGADATISPKSGLTPLHSAAYKGYAHIAELLLLHGAAADAETHSGWTPLQLAVKAEQVAAAQVLLAHGADVNRRDPEGLTPLLCAVEASNRAFVDLLIEMGADVNAAVHADAPRLRGGWYFAGQTPLHCAVQRDDVAIVESLLTAGADPNVGGSEARGTPLHEAVFWPRPQMVKCLIAGGANVNAEDGRGNTALLRAAQSGRWQVVELLAEYGADLTARNHLGETVLHFYFEWCDIGVRGNTQTIEWLLDLGADTGAGEQKLSGTCLHRAASLQFSSNNVEFSPLAAGFLIERGAKVGARDVWGKTPLHRAAYRCNIPVIELLLANGADINARDNEGLVPLHEVGFGASRDDTIEAFAFMVAAGADIRVKSYKQITPLHLAALRAQPGLVGWLLEHGADANARDAFGRTPLHFATLPGLLICEDPFEIAGTLESQEFPSMRAARTLVRLVKDGADPNAKDSQGNAPLHYLLVSSVSGCPWRLLSVCGYSVSGDEHGETVEDSAWRYLYYGCDPLLAAASILEIEVSQLTAWKTRIPHVRKYVEFLKKCGADPNAKNNRGETPIEFARRLSRDYQEAKRLKGEREAAPPEQGD